MDTPVTSVLPSFFVESYFLSMLFVVISFVFSSELSEHCSRKLATNAASDDIVMLWSMISFAPVIINSGDVVVGANNNDSSFQGIIIAGGDVRFDNSVKSFRGIIITGAKLIIDNNMTIKDILTLINLKILDVGFDYNDEINEKGIELERLYDNIFYNNKEV